MGWVGLSWVGLCIHVLGDGGGDDDKISASEEAAVRVIPFGLFSIICSSNIQHDIIPNIYSQL